MNWFLFLNVTYTRCVHVITSISFDIRIEPIKRVHIWRSMHLNYLNLSRLYLVFSPVFFLFLFTKVTRRQNSLLQRPEIVRTPLCLKFSRKTKLIDLTFTWMDSWMKDVSSALLVVYNRTLNENSLVIFWNAKRLLESLAMNHYCTTFIIYFVARFLTDKRIMILMSTCCSVL